VLIEISLILMPVINKLPDTVPVKVQDVDNHGLLLLSKNQSLPVTPLNARPTALTGRKIHWIKREIIPFQTSVLIEISLIPMLVINKPLPTARLVDAVNHGLLLLSKNLFQLVTLLNARPTVLTGRKIHWIN